MIKDTIEQLMQDRISLLRQDTDFVATIFESLVGYGIIAADFDGNIIAYNKGAYQIFGYEPEDMIGRQNIDTLFPADFVKSGKLSQITAALIKEGRISFEGKMLRKNRQDFPVQILFTVTKNKMGKIVGFVVIIQDLTERKQYEEDLIKRDQNLRNILSSNADGIIVVDEEGKTLYTNPAIANIFDHKGKHIIDGYFGIPMIAGETVELDLIGGDNKPKVIEMRATQTIWQGKSAILASIRDITQRKRLERQRELFLEIIIVT